MQTPPQIKYFPEETTTPYPKVRSNPKVGFHIAMRGIYGIGNKDITQNVGVHVR